MLDCWYSLSLGVMDLLIGWLLRLPSDVTLFAVSIGSAALLTLVRLFTTDQDLLRRAAQDSKRLNELIRQARRTGDKQAVQRHRATRSMVAMLKLRVEGLPLLVSIVPIALLATWAMSRLEFHPPKAGEPVKVLAYSPLTAVGDVFHIVPVDGLQADDGWVKPIEESTDKWLPPCGVATWTLRGAARDEPYKLVFRLRGTCCQHELAIGQTTYSSPVIHHDNQVVTELKMEPVKLFGIVPGIPLIGFPAWLTAYLIIVVPFVVILKRLLRIH